MRMKYFILELDQKYPAPRLLGGMPELSRRVLRETQGDQLPKHLMLELGADRQRVFTDVIMYPCLMVSEKIRKVLRSSEPYLRCIRVIAADREQGISRRYYIPVLAEVDCLAEGSRFNIDKSVIHHARIDTGKLNGRALASVGGINCQCILIREDLAENILAEAPIGISLKETELSEHQVDSLGGGGTVNGKND